MTDALMQWLHDAMASPWVYPAMLLLAWLDGFIPAFPSESAVITGGVFAASGVTDWRLVVLASAVGAFIGDHTSYLIGRRFRGPVARRAGPDTKRGGALLRWRGVLDRRGGLVIVVARYVPGGRTAVTVTAGMVGYPIRRFTPFAAIAAVSWAAYGTGWRGVGPGRWRHRVAATRPWPARRQLPCPRWSGTMTPSLLAGGRDDCAWRPGVVVGC